MFTHHKNKKTIKQEFINHFTNFSNKNLHSKTKKKKTIKIFDIDKSLNNQNHEESDLEMLNLTQNNLKLNLSQNNLNSNINQHDQSEILSDNENSNIKN